ncbi:MAG TPA: alpha/beta hydrolase, partial [Bacillota bacterium]|nr:alpha/beta hydrolase [Bacillota bacterium]
MEKIILKDYQDHSIHVYIYRPEGEIKAIVHVIHGAAEHFARYGLFAEFLNKHGYLVIGCDFLGHGLSTDTLEYVHFADKDGDLVAYESILLV